MRCLGTPTPLHPTPQFSAGRRDFFMCLEFRLGIGVSRLGSRLLPVDMIRKSPDARDAGRPSMKGPCIAHCQFALPADALGVDGRKKLQSILACCNCEAVGPGLCSLPVHGGSAFSAVDQY